jgi:hypothetical protein
VHVFKPEVRGHPLSPVCDPFCQPTTVSA